MSKASVGGARYFVKTIDEDSAHVNAFHMKSKAKPANLLKRQVKLVEKQTESKVIKIILNGGRKYLKGLSRLTLMGSTLVLLLTTRVRRTAVLNS